MNSRDIALMNDVLGKLLPVGTILVHNRSNHPVTPGRWSAKRVEPGASGQWYEGATPMEVLDAARAEVLTP